MSGILCIDLFIHWPKKSKTEWNWSRVTIFCLLFLSLSARSIFVSFIWSSGGVSGLNLFSTERAESVGNFVLFTFCGSIYFYVLICDDFAWIHRRTVPLPNSLCYWFNFKVLDESSCILFSINFSNSIPFHVCWVWFCILNCWVMCHPGGCVRQWISAWGQGTGYLGSSKSTRMVIHSFCLHQWRHLPFLNIPFYGGEVLFVSVLICIDIILKHAQSLFVYLRLKFTYRSLRASCKETVTLIFLCVLHFAIAACLLSAHFACPITRTRDFVWVVYLSIILFFSTSLISAVFINTISWLFCCFVLFFLWMFRVWNIHC